MRTNHKLLKKAVALRSAGFTLAAITEKTGISASTLYRHFKALDLKRGALSSLTIDQAKEQLLADGGLVGEIKHLIAAQINEDIALARSIRDGLTLAIEDLINDPSTPASLKSRAYAALATSLKVTSDVARRALQIDDMAFTSQELPTLTICKMTEEDIEEIKARREEEAEY